MSAPQPAPSAHPVLSICIPTYQRSEKLAVLLSSIICQDDPRVEIVVSDNGSADGTAEMVQEFTFLRPLKWHQWNENVGFDRNLMKVVSMASGEYCWLVGSDDALTPGAVSHILDLIGTHRPSGILSSAIICDADLVPMPETASTKPVSFEKIPSDEIIPRIGVYLGFFSLQIVQRQLWVEAASDNGWRNTAKNWSQYYMMLKIAAENNLAETAFYVQEENEFEIRWFTPTVEVDLCGHATLAAAFVLFNHENYTGNTVNFYSPRSGKLTVTKDGDFLTLNFPTDTLREVPLSNEIFNSFDIKPQLAFKGKTDYLLVFGQKSDITDIQPIFEELSKLECRGVIITAKGNTVDFVSRFFAPQSGIKEDPVTGSAHTTLIPYWSKELNKTELTAIQLSERKGHLKCKYLNDRVEISGQAKTYLIGEIFIE
ncbi:MAG: PhzF family phenazine biosynthesis isomerase [Hymenobacter sp.]|nr:MAG: PhzF family phenazine biosynthesis isomerase [Hymenobacter sp.]